MPRSIIILLIILFVDQLDSGMMQPIFPQLFTNPESSELMMDPKDAETKGMLLVALLGAAYALPAFFAQPIIGQLSDRYGRRWLLIASFASSTMSFVLFGLGVTLGAVWLLVVARVIDGLAAGNLLVAQGAIADSSDKESRTQYFSYLAAALSLGFVFGPLLGGYLGDPEAAGWTGPSTAFYVSAVLNTLATVAFYFAFTETLKEEDRDTEDEFAVGQSFSNARDAFTDEKRRPYYLVLLCYIAGYTFFMTFYAVVLEEEMDMDSKQLGWFFAALGLALMLVQLFLTDRFERRFGPRKSLWLAMFSVAGAVGVLGLVSEPWMAYAAILPFALAAGLIDPMIMSLLSKSASDDQQGRVQGVRGSVDSIARTIPPFLAGPIAAAGAANWAVLTGAGVMAVGGILALRLVAGPEAGEGEEEEQGGGEDSPDVARKPDVNPEAATEGDD